MACQYSAAPPQRAAWSFGRSAWWLPTLLIAAYGSVHADVYPLRYFIPGATFEQPWAVASTAGGNGLPTIYVSSTPVRTGFPRDLFGLDVWNPGVHYYLYRQGGTGVDAAKVQSLSDSGVELLRYNGGLSNTWDWSQCTGPVAQRPMQSGLITPAWGGFASMRCVFGLPEYFGLMNTLWSGRPAANRNLMIGANFTGFGWTTGVPASCASPTVCSHQDQDPAKPVVAYNAPQPIATMVSSATGLAQYINAQYSSGAISSNTHVMFELGNEMEKGRVYDDYYPNFTTDELVTRLQQVSNALKSQLPSARLVVPLLTFQPSGPADYPNGYAGHNKRLINEVGSPQNDYALHLYYDTFRNLQPYGQFNDGGDIASTVSAIRNVLQQHKDVKPGQTPNLWITEHARGMDDAVYTDPQSPHYDPNFSPHDQTSMSQLTIAGAGANTNQHPDYTGNGGTGIDPSRYAGWDHLAAVSAADFLTSVVQIPEVAGATWHGLVGHPWYFLPPLLRPWDNALCNPVKNAGANSLTDIYGQIDPECPDFSYPMDFYSNAAAGYPNKTPMQRLFESLATTRAGVPLVTKTRSGNHSAYAGGYDIRSSAFLDTANQKLYLWVVNRDNQAQTVKIVLPGSVTMTNTAGTGTIAVNTWKSTNPAVFQAPVRPQNVSNTNQAVQVIPPGADKGLDSFNMTVEAASFSVVTVPVQSRAERGDFKVDPVWRLLNM